MVPRGGLGNSINPMTYAKVGHSSFPHDHYAFWRECPTINHHLFSVVVVASMLRIGFESKPRSRQSFNSPSLFRRDGRRHAR